MASQTEIEFFSRQQATEFRTGKVELWFSTGNARMVGIGTRGSNFLSRAFCRSAADVLNREGVEILCFGR